MAQGNKAQGIRLFDVFVLAPWLTWLGVRERSELIPVERLLLVSAGLLTAAYNLKNYLETRELEQETAAPSAPAVY